MTVRGKRPILPQAGGQPKKMFTGSSPTGPHMDVLRYAHSGGGETKGKPTGDGNRDLRHQEPNRKR